VRLDGGVGERGDVRAVGDVEAVDVGGAAGVVDFLRQHGQPVFAPGAEHDVVAFAGQAQRGRAADAAAGAGDEDDLHRVPSGKSAAKVVSRQVSNVERRVPSRAVAMS
jgi:hypothetical protein